MLDLVYQMINDSERKLKLLLTKFYGNQHPLSTVFFNHGDFLCVLVMNYK